MKAGRELDALVAEKVMGWTNLHERSHRHSSVKSLMGFPPNTTHYRLDGAGVPNYSTSISAAWQVVEKLCNWDVDDNMLILKGQGPDLEKKEWPDGEVPEWWKAEINGDFSGSPARAEAESAPLAICLAALKVVGERP